MQTFSCFYPDLQPVAYHQFLPPVDDNQIIIVTNHVFSDRRLGGLGSPAFPFING